MKTDPSPVSFPQEYMNFFARSGYPGARSGFVLRSTLGMTLWFPDQITNHEGHLRSTKEKTQCFLSVPSCPLWLKLFAAYLRAAAGSRNPASLASFAALSVASQVKSGSLRPKCPYAAVFL